MMWSYITEENKELDRKSVIMMHTWLSKYNDLKLFFHVWATFWYDVLLHLVFGKHLDGPILQFQLSYTSNALMFW